MARQNLELFIFPISLVVNSCKCLCKIDPYMTCAHKTPSFAPVYCFKHFTVTMFILSP